MKDKACAVVLDHRAGMLNTLVFRHPNAGVQLVKGTCEAGETLAQTVVRELREESGCIARKTTQIGVIEQPDLDERWYVFLCEIGPAPDTWMHDTADDHGHTFAFYWQPLIARAPPDMDARYVKVWEMLLEHAKL